MTVTTARGSFQMADPADPATAVQLARQAMLSGLWRTAPKEGNDLDKALYFLRLKVPAALLLLPRIAIHARTKTPPAGGCHWCVLPALAALSFGEEAEPEPTGLLTGFLGNTCRACRARHDRRDAIVAAISEWTRQEARIDREVAAAGGPLAFYRARQQRDQAVAPYARQIDALATRIGIDRQMVADAFYKAATAPGRPVLTAVPLDRRRDAATLRAVAAWKARRSR